MKKIVISTSYGGFGISHKALEFIAERKGLSEDQPLITRDDVDLVAAVEQIGSLASGNFADLKVVEIPDDVNWVIEEYDGKEWIAESHRTWR